MRFAASHGFTEVQPWPVDSSGRDLSIIRNQTDGPVSLFVHGSREPFMGVWNPHTNSGTVHYAEYDALPGKKTWSWGVDADGLDWRKALSDNDSAYVEVQGGLFRNQETYAFLEPRRTIEFSEYWMPVREIGGITCANLNGILALNRDESNLAVAFNSNQPIPSATISVLAGDKQVWTGRADLLPEQAFAQHVPIPDANEKYTIEVRDRSGNLLMQQTEDQYDWAPISDIKVGPQKSYKIPARENRTEDDWLQLGEKQELNGELLIAWQTYSDLLKKNPESYAGLKAGGRLAVTLLHYDDAVRYLEQVRSRNTTDGEAAYYLGLAYEGLELKDKARNALESAYRLPQWRAAAALRLAELSAGEKNLAQAERYLNESVESDPNDVRAAEELAAVESALHKNNAGPLAKNFLQRFPLSYLLREETGTADLQQLANDSSRILNLAAQYIRLGLDRKALDVLSRPYPQPAGDQSEPDTPAATSNPMLAYYRAYCRGRLGEDPVADYKAASSLPTDYIFPSSAQDLAVLRAAIKSDPADSHAHYLLGTLDFSKGLTDEALSEWNAAQNANANIPVLNASMGIALLHAKDDPEAALEAFTHGIKTDPRNEAVYAGADQALSILKKPSTDRVHALELYPDQAKMPASMVFELALNLAESGDHERSAALFHDRFFPREEGGTNVRQVWVEVQLLSVLDRARHGQCDQASAIASKLGSSVSGVSFTSDGMEPFINSARTNYLLGEMAMQCKMPDQARQHFTNAAGRSGSNETVWAWLAAKQLPGFDASKWNERLESALQQASGMTESSSFAGWWVYDHGMLNRALGNEQEAQQDFRRVFLLPDRLLSYHLAREAMAAHQN
jgi:Flp pilus assembly protein TadD